LIGRTSSIAPIEGFAIAARHFFDELTLGQNAIEFHIATNVILATDLTNLQFLGLASLAHGAGDYLFEKMVHQHPDGRSPPRSNRLSGTRTRIKHDPEYAHFFLRQMVLAKLACSRS
jgi:hypothetical protein